MKNAALRSMTDTESLMDFAIVNDLSVSTHTRREALKCLTKQQDILAVAKKASDSSVRSAAVDLLTGQDELLDLVKTAPDPEVRADAVRKLELKEADFIELAKTSPEPHVRAAAVLKITDTAALREISKTEKDKIVLKNICGGKVLAHKMKGCRCTRCDREIHDFVFSYKADEQISRIAAIQYDLYTCTRCGKTEQRNVVGGGID